MVTVFELTVIAKSSLWDYKFQAHHDIDIVTTQAHRGGSIP